MKVNFFPASEVQGSCQRVDGNSNNLGLLAYLLDGKNRLLEIKDKQGKIVGRRILRILWDSKNQRPALMLERVYPQTLSPSLQKALESFAIERAKKLRLELFEACQNLDNEIVEDIKLQSLGGKSKWEYVDSAGGMKDNGIYTVDNVKKICEFK